MFAAVSVRYNNRVGKPFLSVRCFHKSPGVSAGLVYQVVYAYLRCSSAHRLGVVMIMSSDAAGSHRILCLSPLAVGTASHTWATLQWSLTILSYYRSPAWNTDSLGERCRWLSGGPLMQETLRAQSIRTGT